MVLYAAATHALTAFPTFGRMLFTSEHEASGKTMGMAVTAALCANPLDASGTSYALTSALAAAGNTPDQPLRSTTTRFPACSASLASLRHGTRSRTSSARATRGRHIPVVREPRQ